MLRFALVLCVLAATACGTEPGSGVCVETTIDAPPVTVVGTAPLTLTATLTRRDGGSPVAGADLTFFAQLTKATGSATGVRIGEAKTDTSRKASYERADGVDGLGFSDEHVTGYSVEYNPLTTIDDVQYCRTRTDASVTVS